MPEQGGRFDPHRAARERQDPESFHTFRRLTAGGEYETFGAQLRDSAAESARAQRRLFAGHVRKGRKRGVVAMAHSGSCERICTSFSRLCAGFAGPLGPLRRNARLREGGLSHATHFARSPQAWWRLSSGSSKVRDCLRLSSFALVVGDELSGALRRGTRASLSPNSSTVLSKFLTASANCSTEVSSAVLSTGSRPRVCACRSVGAPYPIALRGGVGGRPQEAEAP